MNVSGINAYTRIVNLPEVKASVNPIFVSIYAALTHILQAYVANPYAVNFTLHLKI